MWPLSQMCSRGALLVARQSQGRCRIVFDFLEQAIHQRRQAQGQLVLHSDRGSQYLSIKFTKRLAEANFYAALEKAEMAA